MFLQDRAALICDRQQRRPLRRAGTGAAAQLPSLYAVDGRAVVHRVAGADVSVIRDRRRLCALSEQRFAGVAAVGVEAQGRAADGDDVDGGIGPGVGNAVISGGDDEADAVTFLIAALVIG